MKKILLSLITTGSLLTAGSFGQLGLGYSKGNNADNFITAFGSLNVLGNIGARLEYTKNMTENPAFSKENISRYGLFATYNLPLVGGFSVTPKIGLTKTDGSFTVSETLKEVSKSSTNFTYGLEVNYAFNEKMYVYAGYTDYGNKLDIQNLDTSKMDTANYTFGIKLNF
jgi:opacity protein-like surface antigen